MLISTTYVGTNSAEVKLKHNGNVVLCESAGNVGINTGNPQESLHTAGNIRLGDTAPAELYTNTNELRLGVDKNNDNDNSDITFYVNDDQKARINKDGQFALGTLRTDALVNIGTHAAGSEVSGTLDLRHTDNNGVNIWAKDTDSSTNFNASVINYDVSGDQAITGAQTYHRAMYIDVDSSATGGTPSNEHRLFGIDVNLNAAGDSDVLYGVNATVISSSDGAGDDNQNTTIQGASFAAQNQGSGDSIVSSTYGAKMTAFNRSTSSDSTTRNIFGSFSEAVLHADATKKTNFRGLYSKVDIRETTNACNVGNVFGVYSSIFNNQTNNVTLDSDQYLFYGSYNGSQSTVTNANRTPWGVYIPSDVENYVEGKLGVGNNNPVHKLDVTGSIGSTGNIETDAQVHAVSYNATASGNSSAYRVGNVAVIDGNRDINANDITCDSLSIGNASPAPSFAFLGGTSSSDPATMKLGSLLEASTSMEMHSCDEFTTQAQNIGRNVTDDVIAEIRAIDARQLRYSRL